MERHATLTSPHRIVSGSAADTHRRSSARRLFGLTAIVALTVLGIAMGTSFAAIVSSSPSPLSADGKPLMLGSNAPVPAAVKALRYSLTSASPNGRRLTWRPPALAVAGSAAQVASAGDLVLINTTGRSTPLPVQLYITNMPDLASSYSSFVLPIALWQSPDPARHGSWKRSAAAYITGFTGKISFNLPSGGYYDITIERGGGLQRIPGHNAVAPAFFAVS